MQHAISPSEREMPPNKFLGEFEQMILLAILRAEIEPTRWRSGKSWKRVPIER